MKDEAPVKRSKSGVDPAMVDALMKIFGYTRVSDSPDQNENESSPGKK